MVGAQLVAATVGAVAAVMAARTSSGGLDGRRSQRGGSVHRRRVTAGLASDRLDPTPLLPRSLGFFSPNNQRVWRIRPGWIQWHRQAQMAGERGICLAVAEEWRAAGLGKTDFHVRVSHPHGNIAIFVDISGKMCHLSSLPSLSKLPLTLMVNLELELICAKLLKEEAVELENEEARGEHDGEARSQGRIRQRTSWSGSLAGG
uniref:Uncharacterized protein n=1 Tax=Oryza meridionalis TaxID=40149 RepID=A0A0E0CJT8_9ORYZ